MPIPQWDDKTVFDVEQIDKFQKAGDSLIFKIQKLLQVMQLNNIQTPGISEALSILVDNGQFVLSNQPRPKDLGFVLGEELAETLSWFDGCPTAIPPQADPSDSHGLANSSQR